MITSYSGRLQAGAFLRAQMTVILIGLAAAVGTGQAHSFAGGTGGPDDPYQIATAEQLIAIGQDRALQVKQFILTADIDLSGTVFSGPVIPAFYGTFDGNDCTIRGMTIRGADRLGLLGELLNGGLIKDLNLQAVDVAGAEFIGGPVGYNWNGSVVDCHTSGRVNGTGRFAGGLIGLSFGRVANCSSACAVDGNTYVGGLAGRVTNGVVDCHSTGPVRGDNHIGGLIGENSGQVSGCFSTSAVSGAGDYVGGLIGTNFACVVCSWATGVVTGEGHAGGLLGHNDYNGRVINCYSTSAVSGASGVGGLAGTNIGSVANCYSAGPVDGAGEYVGGLVGSGWARTTGCFWDVDASGQVRSTGGKGLNSSEVREVSIYLAAGWDLVGEAANGLSETWKMPEQGGYPVLSIFDGYVPPTLAGQGSPQDPYLVSTPLELGSVCYDPLACYRLAVSIDLSDTRWSVPVIPVFFGRFDGNDLMIRHVAVVGESGLGLFGDLAPTAMVMNLAVEDVNIVGSGKTAGGLAGENRGSMHNCRVTGSVNGGIEVGGLVGLNASYSQLAGCHSDCVVTGDTGVGGLAGANWGTVTASSSTGVIKGNAHAGGLIGENQGRVVECRSSGSVTPRIAGGGHTMGGLVGWNYGSVADCCSTGSVSGSGAVGGLLGTNASGTVTNCTSSGEVRGAEYIGGLIGVGSGLVAACYSSGPVNGTGERVGGLLGYGDYESSVINCYSRSNVGGTAEFVGGLVGYCDSIWGSLLNCYSTGAVSGRSNVGGLVGKCRNLFDVIECFWDVDTSGQMDSDAGIGLTTAAMKDFFTFVAAGWDFVGESKNGTDDIWIGMIDDYPQLRWQHGK
jgi:hypothetical protein